MIESNIQPFGYTEMYEWDNPPEHKNRLGRLVTFSKDMPDKICYAKGDDFILGVTTVCAVDTSDDPDEWKYSYLCNEYGDLYMKKERLAVGTKQYDQHLEINYIRTYPWEHFIKIESPHLDKEKKYVKRSSRQEWVRVCLTGKTIALDNGKCKPGDWCCAYSGKVKDMYGTVVPWNQKTMKDKKKFYVLNRLSENTIMILVK